MLGKIAKNPMRKNSNFWYMPKEPMRLSRVSRFFDLTFCKNVGTVMIEKCDFLYFLFFGSGFGCVLTVPSSSLNGNSGSDLRRFCCSRFIVELTLFSVVFKCSKRLLKIKITLIKKKRKKLHATQNYNEVHHRLKIIILKVLFKELYQTLDRLKKLNIFLSGD